MDTDGADTATAVNDATRRVKDSATLLGDQAKTNAQQALSAGAERVAGKTENVTQSLRRAAEDVEGDQKWLGAALRKSADTLEHATQSLKGGDVNQALGELNGFARRQPALFLGASLALGFALARVGKTAIEQQQSSMPPQQPT